MERPFIDRWVNLYILEFTHFVRLPSNQPSYSVQETKFGVDDKLKICRLRTGSVRRES